MTRGLELDNKRKDRCNAKTFDAIRTADEEMVESYDPMGCEAIRQPSLLENMVETSQKLERIENKIDSLVGILFGNHAVCEDCREKEGLTNIEGEAHKARMSADRIFEGLTNIIERLAD